MKHYNPEQPIVSNSNELYFVLSYSATGLKIRLPNGTTELINPCGSIGKERIIVRTNFPQGTQILNQEDIKS